MNGGAALRHEARISPREETLVVFGEVLDRGRRAAGAVVRERIAYRGVRGTRRKARDEGRRGNQRHRGSSECRRMHGLADLTSCFVSVLVLVVERPSHRKEEQKQASDERGGTPNEYFPGSVASTLHVVERNQNSA
jgi:hypothetical protein